MVPTPGGRVYLDEKDTHILRMFCAHDKFNRHRLDRLDMDDIEQ
jgi:putative component of toxin-antitoxin plasmid stabilization module